MTWESDVQLANADANKARQVRDEAADAVAAARGDLKQAQDAFEAAVTELQNIIDGKGQLRLPLPADTTDVSVLLGHGMLSGTIEIMRGNELETVQRVAELLDDPAQTLVTGNRLENLQQAIRMFREEQAQ